VNRVQRAIFLTIARAAAWLLFATGASSLYFYHRGNKAYVGIRWTRTEGDIINREEIDMNDVPFHPPRQAPAPARRRR
jgi:hypothetical protein